MIRVDDLEITYDGISKILEDITFDVKEGTFFGIIGPNGSGKTTLLKALSRALTPVGGVILIGEKELRSFSHRELAQELGVVPQDSNIHFDFSVRDIVTMGRHPYIDRFSSETRDDLEIVRNAMKLTNTLHLADRSINEISGGERQRVIIARALAQQPRILLLDEPTSHLDISHQIEICTIMKRLTAGMTVIAIFHDLNFASYYCDRLILLNAGTIVSLGTPAEVMTRENILANFSINAIVRINPLTKKPYIIPRMEEQEDVRGNLRIHVICGGGYGSDIMYTLHKSGFALSAGVLCVNDSDFATAIELGIPCIGEPPFSAVSPTSLDELKMRLEEADIIIVTEMPVGPGNIENLRLLENYQEKAMIIFQSGGSDAAMQDFTGGEATRILDRIHAGGAKSVQNNRDLIEQISTF